MNKRIIACLQNKFPTCVYICYHIVQLISFTRSTYLSLYQFILHVGPNCEVESPMQSSSVKKMLTSIYSSLQYFLFILTRRHTADFCLEKCLPQEISLAVCTQCHFAVFHVVVSTLNAFKIFLTSFRLYELKDFTQNTSGQR